MRYLTYTYIGIHLYVIYSVMLGVTDVMRQMLKS